MRQSRVGSAFVLALRTEPSSSTSFRRMSALCYAATRGRQKCGKEGVCVCVYVDRPRAVEWKA